MLIENKIQMTKDGLVISQRIGTTSVSSQPQPGIVIEHNELGASIEDSKAGMMAKGDNRDYGGDGPNDRDGPGGSGTGSAPVNVIGPIIFICAPKSPDTEKADPQQPLNVEVVDE